MVFYWLLKKISISLQRTETAWSLVSSWIMWYWKILKSGTFVPKSNTLGSPKNNPLGQSLELWILSDMDTKPQLLIDTRGVIQSMQSRHTSCWHNLLPGQWRYLQPKEVKREDLLLDPSNAPILNTNITRLFIPRLKELRTLGGLPRFSHCTDPVVPSLRWECLWWSEAFWWGHVWWRQHSPPNWIVLADTSSVRLGPEYILIASGSTDLVRFVEVGFFSLSNCGSLAGIASK